MGRKIPGAALLAAAALAAALPCEAAYVRGDLVWKCDFTPEEAARSGVAGLRFDESGRGADYDPRGGAAGDGALHFRSPSQDYEVKIPVRHGATLTGMLLVEADVRGVGIGDGVLSVRSLTFAAAQTLALEQIAGRPAFVEEHGARRQEQTSREGVARYLRGMLWNLWAADGRGMLWWCAFDQTGQTFAPYDWRQPCVELGLFRRDRVPYPAVDAVRAFAAMQETLPFPALPKAKPDAVVIAADNDVIHSSYVLARQAGLFPAFASPEKPLPDAACYFLPDAQGRAFLTLERWEELKARVRAGATLYLSWNDTFLDSLEEVAGVEIAFREKRAGIDRCDFGDFSVEIPFAVKRRFRALTAEPLAVNQDGEGVFFRNRYGEGTVFLCAHNVEKTFYEGAGHYEGDAWKIWATVRPVDRLLSTGDRNVLVSEHGFDDGRVGIVAVNNGTRPCNAASALRDGWRVVRAITDDPAAAAWSEGTLSLAPCAGILLLAERRP